MKLLKVLSIVVFGMTSLPKAVFSSPLKYEYQSTIYSSQVTSLMNLPVDIILTTDPDLVFPYYNSSSNFGSYTIPFSDITLKMGNYRWDYSYLAGNIRVQNDYVTMGTKQDAVTFGAGNIPRLENGTSFLYNGINLTLTGFDASIILRSPNREPVPALLSNSIPTSLSGFDVSNLPDFSLSGGLMLFFKDPQSSLSITSFGDFKSASLKPVPLPPSFFLMASALFLAVFSRVKFLN